MSQQIGQYRIIGEIGAGGMGVVYRAVDVEIQREVAIKRLRSEFAASPQVLERFHNEAKMQGRLNHANIAQLYSLVQTPEAFCIVMELVEGIVVKDLLPLAWPEATAVLLQALDALGYAHSLGVLHRDIKPENILIDRRGTVKVMDFGIAYAVGSERMTREKSLIGTIEYMSPERILGRTMDARSDIYALGILLFEMLSGRLPFDNASEYDLLRSQVESEPPPLSSVANAPACFDQPIQQAMRKDPAERYSSCEEMAADIRALLPGPPATSEALRNLVVSRARPGEGKPFDAPRCWSQVKRLIDSGDLSAAQRQLLAELDEHPREMALRSYHRMIAAALHQTAFASQNALTLPWLRLIAAERASDYPSYEKELEGLVAEFPDEPLTQLLHAGAETTRNRERGGLQ
jgi:serine/threonine protein kinase